MSDLKEKLAKLEEAAAADEAFGKELAAALESRNRDETIRIAAEKGIELSADDFTSGEVEAKEVDESELNAVAGGYSYREDREEDVAQECERFASFICGLSFGSSWWIPKD